MGIKFYAKLAGLGFAISLLCAGCGTGMTVIAMESPTISQVSPQVVTAGTPSVTVTVQGTNFLSAAALSVNGTAVPTTVVNSTTIAATISGTTLAQPAVAQLQVKNSDGAQSNQVALTVTSAPGSADALSITTTQLPSAQVGTAYKVSLGATGGLTPYKWTISSGNLPSGLTLSSGGIISGTPTTSGTSTFSVTVTDSASKAQTKTVTYSIVVASAQVVPTALVISTTSLGSGQVGTSYSASLSAGGGTPNYTWSVSSGKLPAGLTLSNAGVISGTPTASGTSTFTIAVKDSGSPAQTSSAQESITVNAAPAKLTITSTSLPAGNNGGSYSASLSATGGTPSYTWSISSGSLPPGLKLSSAGVISGTPSSSGTWSFTVAVKDSGSPAQTDSAQVSIAVSAAPATLTITTTSLAGAKGGSSYSVSLSATGGTPNYIWSIASGSLPAGLSLSSAGVISGTATGSGTSTFTVAVKDSGSPVQTASSQESIAVTAAPATLTIATTSLAGGKSGSSYSASLSATGGTPNYTWSITSGSLPAGLSLSSAGVISGTPTGSGTSTFTVAVKDSGSPVQTASSQESIAVSAAPATLTITTTSLAAAKDGSSYNSSLSASGGTPGYTWSVSGSLPAGLTMSAAGVISGTPTGMGTSTFTVTASDSASPSETASAQLSITASAASSTLTITTTSLGAAQTGSSYSTTLSATGGTPNYAWSVTSGSLPAGLTMSSGGVISGTPTATGTSTFTVMVTDSASPAQTATVQESLAVTTSQLAIISPNPGSGVVGTGYNVTLSASGGVPGYSWSVSSGSLPAGLTLSSTGVISGSPTTTGTSAFTITVTDNESPAQTVSAQDSITVVNANAGNPPGGEQIYVYPLTPIAPRGAYQTVTAIVTGTNDKTVTWTSNGGTIVGTNPCVVNEPCTVALYSTQAGTYSLTATSNANHSIVATSSVTFTASPTPRTDHPRFMMTSDMLTSLQAKANSSNTMYQAIKSLATNYYTQDSSLWAFSSWNGSACTGGSGPNSDQSANYRENDAWWMALVALLDSDASTRNQYGCAARDVFIANLNYVLSGEIDLSGGNRWSDGANEWALTADYLMGAGYLSQSDIAIARQYLAKLAYEQINDSGNGDLAVIGNYNSTVQFAESNELSAAGMRAMGNNYTQSRVLVLTAAALTFNDNTTDDPPLTNTCNATRYQVCPDGTAGSLHAYWTYVTGGMLYKDWANMEDPSVVQQAYNAVYNNLPSQPMCNTLWQTPVSCLGAARGGESNEGTIYGNSLSRLRMTMNAIHTAGYDDPVQYGPQISIGTMSYWDLRYVADFALLTGLSGDQSEQARWNVLTDGDSLTYYTYPANYESESAMLSSDAVTGRTDRASAVQWLVMNTAFGMANGTTGNCIWYCGLNTELQNTYGANVALDMFLALPAGDPTTNNPPADPRPSLPTDWFDAGNQHIVARSGWGTDTNTIFSYYCTNTQIDHEHQFCGGFDLYSNGEYITKGRMEFNDYNDEMSSAWNKNSLSLIQFPGQTWCTSNPWCQYNQSATDGGQWWHGYQAGLTTLYHSEVPGYVAAVADMTNGYNGGWGGYANFNTVTAASRSLVYLRGSNQVIYYDRGDTGSNTWDKATYLVTTGAPTITGNTATWLTRSGNQKVYWTALESSANTPQLDATYTDSDQANDWEIYGRIKADAGSVASGRFLSVLQWGPSTFAGSSATLVSSSSGTSFEGALVGTSLVMFIHDWPSALTTVTYPASGATTQYVSDLTPNTTYNITGAGAPTTATSDNAGVLTFTAAGTGNITITPGT